MAEFSNQELTAAMPVGASPDSDPPNPLPEAAAQPAVRQLTQLEFDWVYSPLVEQQVSTLQASTSNEAGESGLDQTLDRALDRADTADSGHVAPGTRSPETPSPENRHSEAHHLGTTSEIGGNVSDSNVSSSNASLRLPGLDLELPQDPYVRIQQLEQALDQCQTYIDELKQQLVEQQFLEEVLAKTEEAAHVQQQAINTLKQQLEQQDTLEAQLRESETTRLALQAALQNSEFHAQSARNELAQLQKLQQQWQTEVIAVQQQAKDVQNLLSEKDAELNQLQSQLQQTEELTEQRNSQLALIKSRVQQLEADLRERQQNLRDAEARLQRNKEVATAQQEIIDNFQTPGGSDASKNKLIQSISKTLLNAQHKIEALEAELSGQRITQAKLQHSSQELEEKSRDYLKRIDTLEKQTAEMQEQILQQAQQASEYETAVQHWKDRCQDAEESLVQLKAVLEQMVTDRQPSELELASHGNGADTTESAGILKGLKLDLPGFLHLRRTNVRS